MEPKGLIFDIQASLCMTGLAAGLTSFWRVPAEMPLVREPGELGQQKAHYVRGKCLQI